MLGYDMDEAHELIRAQMITSARVSTTMAKRKAATELVAALLDLNGFAEGFKVHDVPGGGPFVTVEVSGRSVEFGYGGPETGFLLQRKPRASAR